ncbi:hypothetical protein CLV49_3287 [Labedella gwakjiensis]|uniref:Uncharacterized protein n=1 Tax=Labedella gwakjiensis TaxID=390269 RepID=A0A2P8H0A6_9MICO|nr:hypothetical protein [Labedella gwakjiensis]PSL39643.1 hypothetical protein CLV49_3287 [Labedella gwakjiensis]RUQ85967.1 hypothetical protein ELQ93_02820 [Labedella gwakjiensis]
MPDVFSGEAVIGFGPDDSLWAVTTRVSQELGEVLSRVGGKLRTEGFTGSANDGTLLQRKTLGELQAAFESHNLQPSWVRQFMEVRQVGFPRRPVQGLGATLHTHFGIRDMSIHFQGTSSVVVRGAKEQMQEFMDSVDRRDFDVWDFTSVAFGHPKLRTRWSQRWWVRAIIVAAIGLPFAILTIWIGFVNGWN